MPRAKLDEPQTVRTVSSPHIHDDAHIQPAKVAVSPSEQSTPQNSREQTTEPPRPGLDGVKKILERAEAFQQRYPDYILRLTRNERVRGTSHAPEVILMKLRSNPKSVFLKWLDESNDGRECIWVEGQNNGKMISRGGKGDLLLAGKTLWLDPNGTLARSKSSQPITESGLDVILQKIRARVVRLEQNDESLGTLQAVREPDAHDPTKIYDWIIHQAPPGVDSDLPNGGIHRYGFRIDNGRVEAVHASDDRGEFLYTFRFERFIPVADLTPEDFDPELVWPKKQANRPPSEHEKMVQSKDQPAF